jgi:hypothetical protein
MPVVCGSQRLPNIAIYDARPNLSRPNFAPPIRSEQFCTDCCWQIRRQVCDIPRLRR